MTRAASILAIVGASAIAVSLAACGSDAPAPAGLMLAIDTDLAPGKDFDRLEVEVRPPAGYKQYSQVFSEFGQPGLPLSFPTTLAVIDDNRGSESVTIRVSIGKSGLENSPVGKPLVLREVVTTMPTDRVALLRIHVEWLCIGTAEAKPDYVEGLCPEGFTCLGGKCEDWAIDSRTLPTYDERAVFGGGSARGEGACFDTTACFAAATNMMPDAACSVPKPATGEPNVALVVPEGSGGVCAGGTCLIALEPNSPYGFVAQGDRLQFPPAVCNALAKKTALGITVATACPSKLPSLPTCGPWSAIHAK